MRRSPMSDETESPKEKPDPPGNEAAAGPREAKLTVERVQLGVRMEKRMAKVLKAIAELKDQSLGELLETIVLHAFEGTRAFPQETLEAIANLKQVYGM